MRLSGCCVLGLPFAQLGGPHARKVHRELFSLARTGKAVRLARGPPGLGVVAGFVVGDGRTAPCAWQQLSQRRRVLSGAQECSDGNLAMGWFAHEPRRNRKVAVHRFRTHRGGGGPGTEPPFVALAHHRARSRSLRRERGDFAEVNSGIAES